MTAENDQDPPDRRALVSTFAGRVSKAKGGTGSKVMAAVLITALAGGAVVGVGYLTRPGKKHPVSAMTAARQSVTTAPGPAAGQPGPAAPTPVPSVQTVTPRPAPIQTVLAPPLPVQTVTIPPAPAQTVTIQPVPMQPTPTARPRARKKPKAPAARKNSPAFPSVSATEAFAAVTGFGCAPTATARFTEHGRWTNGLKGFIAVPAGAPRGDGCNGAFDAMPMSGSATKPDPTNFAVWTFHTGPITHGVCHIDVYVPDDPSLRHVGGHPADYQVFGSARATGTPLGSFDIDQHFNRGRWASRHNWRITGGVLTVKLDSRGIDWSGKTQTHAHIAVSAVSLTCAP
jgi:hypothetical protein